QSPDGSSGLCSLSSVSVCRCPRGHLASDLLPLDGRASFIDRLQFFDLHANHSSQIAAQALPFFAALYDIERDAAMLQADERQKLRQSRAKPVCGALHEWMKAQRKLVSEGSAIAKALDYSLKRWEALTRYLDDGHVPIHNNWVENQIRPWAI
ncbi:transposase, partial [Paraburkholderia sp. BR10923]